MSRQRVAQLFAEAADFPPPQAALGSRRLWGRNAIEAWAAGHPDRGPPYRSPATQSGEMPRGVWQVSKLATDEARQLHHDSVGMDHLLVALLHPECPGAAREALASFGVSLDEAREGLVESLGDPFEDTSQGWVSLPPATQLFFERATLKAVELRDEEVASEHVLLASIDAWSDRGTPAFLDKPGLTADALRQRVIALTEESRDVPETPASIPPATHAQRRIPRPPEPDLAPTPGGHDPRRRRPWGSAVFHDAQGRPVTQGIWLRQYFIDRDGNPILTVDGRPIHLLIDEEGYPVLDEVGQHIIAPVEIPPGSAIKQKE